MKLLRTAAFIIGAVALVATGVGAVVGATAFAAATGVSLATVSAIGTIAGIVGQLTAPKPKNTVQGSQTDFKLDPQASVPIQFGRTLTGGNIIARETWGEDNQYQGFVIAYSGCGPVAGFDGFYIDRALAINGTGAIGGQYAGFAWWNYQLGATPEPAALAIPVAGWGAWTAAHKLSGIFAGSFVLKFDEDGEKWAGGVPRSGVIGRGVLCYDPRLDSTYPGGVGACRIDDQSTWVESRNGPLQALTFAIGWRQNGKPAGGVQASEWNIDIPAFVQAANVADANGWESGGVYSTGDAKWTVLRGLLQSAAAEPVWLGARLSVRQYRPRVSVATITSRDVRGAVKVIGAQTWRTGRINGMIPIVRSESHGFEQVPGSVVRVPEYVLADGGERTREVTFQTVQDFDQGGQLAAYEIVNGREIGPLTLPVGPEYAGLVAGMCVDLDIPEASLFGQWEVLGVRFGHTDAVATLELQSETAEKHAFALGTTSTPPPTPDLTPPDYEAIRLNFETASQAASAIRLSSVGDLVVTASDAGDATANISVPAHVRDYPDRAQAINAQVLAGAPLETTVFIYYDDQSRTDPDPVMQWTTDYETSVNDSATAPFRHYVARVTTPAAGGGDTGGTPPSYPGGGGYCVREDMTILMADGSEKPAGELEPGEMIRTRHHVTLEWGEYPVGAVERVSMNLLVEAQGLVGSPDHRIFWNGAWRALREIGTIAPAGRVVKITVPDAQSYVSAGLLSHNTKYIEP